MKLSDRHKKISSLVSGHQKELECNYFEPCTVDDFTFKMIIYFRRKYHSHFGQNFHKFQFFCFFLEWFIYSDKVLISSKNRQLLFEKRDPIFSRHSNLRGKRIRRHDSDFFLCELIITSIFYRLKAADLN